MRPVMDSFVTNGWQALVDTFRLPLGHSWLLEDNAHQDGISGTPHWERKKMMYGNSLCYIQQGDHESRDSVDQGLDLVWFWVWWSVRLPNLESAIFNSGTGASIISQKKLCGIRFWLCEYLLPINSTPSTVPEPAKTDIFACLNKCRKGKA
jgi:hypothetical protein